MELTADDTLTSEILNLKNGKNASILGHYYQRPEIQEIADFVGDSLDLSKKAAQTDADVIVFCGVHFMAETAKILNPEKKVLLPDLDAGCSLATSCPPAAFKAFCDAHPDHVVVTYINCSAEIKALSDIICTSSNAVRIIQSIPVKQPVIFAPDKNLGRYLMKVTGRDMLLWDGTCIVHEAFSFDKLLALCQRHPDASIIAHPESESHVLEVASFVGSTSALLKHVKTSASRKFIVGTEAGILYKMAGAVPGKTLIPLPAEEDNTCACSECAYMKLNTLEKLRDCLINESPEIKLPGNLAERAAKPLERMLNLNIPQR